MCKVDSAHDKLLIEWFESIQYSEADIFGVTFYRNNGYKYYVHYKTGFQSGWFKTQQYLEGGWQIFISGKSIRFFNNQSGVDSRWFTPQGGLLEENGWSIVTHKKGDISFSNSLMGVDSGWFTPPGNLNDCCEDMVCQDGVEYFISIGRGIDSWWVKYQEDLGDGWNILTDQIGYKYLGNFEAHVEFGWFKTFEYLSDEWDVLTYNNGNKRFVSLLLNKWSNLLLFRNCELTADGDIVCFSDSGAKTMFDKETCELRKF